MEQRRLRLGDILDDYCPRERRVTNHAVVAMIEDDVKQTRCTTCDTEHAYKGGREPRRRKKDATAVLYAEVLAGMSEPAGEGVQIDSAGASLAPVLAAAPPNGNGNGHPPAYDAAEDPMDDEPVAAASEPPAGREDEPVDEEPREDQPEPADDGPIHRRLIRATLPRPEGQKIERQLPDFTIRPNGNHFRGDRMKMRGPGGAGGDGSQRGGRRFRGPSSGGGGRPGFGGNRGPSTGSGRGPSTGSGRGRKRGR